MESSADNSNSAVLLKYQTLSSFVSVSFWFRLSQNKLSDYKLSEDPIPLRGYYNVGSSTSGSHHQQSQELPSQFFLEGEGFDKDPQLSGVVVPGTLYNTNTLNSFKEMDKKALFNNVAQQVRMLSLDSSRDILTCN
jgi:ubiquitin-like modifier-activating enzyme ATG7